MNSKTAVQITEYEFALRERTCPGLNILFGEATGTDGDNLKKHLHGCEACRDTVECGAPEPVTVKTAPEQTVNPFPGEIWRLKATLSGWGNGRYVNAPAVLITEGAQPAGNSVTVVQIHSFAALQSADDLILGTADELLWIAETWNRYQLKIEDLECRLTEIADGEGVTIQDVRRLAASPAEPGSATIALFRTLERSVGEVVAGRSLYRAFSTAGIIQDESLLERIASFLRAEGKQFCDEVRKRNPRWTFPEGVADAAVAISRAVPFPELRQLCGAGDDSSFPAPCLSLKNGAPVLSLTSYAILNESQAGDELRMGGELAQDAPRCQEIHAWWVLDEGTRIPALEQELRTAAGRQYFDILFAGLHLDCPDVGQLALLLVSHGSE